MSDTELDLTDFGPNMWLVDDMYRRYLEDPGSVSASWQEFFEDYRPHSMDLARSAPAQPMVAPAASPAAPTATPETAVAATVAPALKPSPDGQAVAAEAVPLRGAAAVVVERMEASREIPTATSVRNIPAKLL
ncbi:MAG: 2-oxoglutarate dehydrogenase E1 subunit family protein, partial [Actinomycetota bacterium]